MAKIEQTTIDQAKEKHGTVFHFIVEDKECLLKKPDRKTLSFLSTITNSIKYNESLLKACWIEGDEEIQTDDEYFFGISVQLDQLISFKKAELVKY